MPGIQSVTLTLKACSAILLRGIQPSKILSVSIFCPLNLAGRNLLLQQSHKANSRLTILQHDDAKTTNLTETGLVNRLANVHEVFILHVEGRNFTSRQHSSLFDFNYPALVAGFGTDSPLRLPVPKSDTKVL